MVQKLIAAIGAAATVAALSMGTPAKAEPVTGAVLAAGFVGGVFGAGLMASSRDEPRILADAPVHWWGVPGYEKRRVLRPVLVEGRHGPRTAYALPVVGPGRHTVCGWQERYDRHERYIGSRQICWVEAR